MPKFQDFIDHETEQKDIAYYTQRFVLHPKFLQGLQLPVSLTWQQTPFLPQNASAVVKETGIYAFVIQHDAKGLPPHGYVAYIGQAGAKKHSRTLQARFKEYLNNKKRPKRPRIWALLNKWETCLVFHFAAIDAKSVNLLEVEAKLNDAMFLPYPQNDFSPSIRPKKNIWEAS